MVVICRLLFGWSHAIRWSSPCVGVRDMGGTGTGLPETRTYLDTNYVTEDRTLVL